MNAPTVTLDPSDVHFFQSTSHAPEVRVRGLTERILLRRTIEALLAAGFHVSVDSGEDATPTLTDRDAILKETMSTDQDVLYVYREPKKSRSNLWGAEGYVLFVYGNDGWDAISDYSTNLEDVLEPVNDFAETLQNGALFLAPDTQARHALNELVQWVDRTGVTSNPALAGIDTSALDTARALVAAAFTPFSAMAEEPVDIADRPTA